MAQQKPLVAISMGDPAGIGPEISLKAAADPSVQTVCRPVVIGDLQTLRSTAARLGMQTPVLPAPPHRDAEGWNGVPVVDLGNLYPGAIPPAEVSQKAGWVSWEYVRAAVRMVLSGAADALVTAPVSRAAIRLAGLPFDGHEQMLGQLTGTAEPHLLLSDDPLRVALLSAHLPLRTSLELVTRDRVVRVIRLTADYLRDLGIERPTIGVAGLSPYPVTESQPADEEDREILPAIHLARAEAIAVEGPVAASAVFRLGRSGTYDAVVAMFHDQGHLPVQGTGYGAISVTLGLPLVQTGPAHGPAFGLAEKGIADPGPMVEAILLAVRVFRGRQLRRRSVQ